MKKFTSYFILRRLYRGWGGTEGEDPLWSWAMAILIVLMGMAHAWGQVSTGIKPSDHGWLIGPLLISTALVCWLVVWALDKWSILMSRAWGAMQKRFFLQVREGELPPPARMTFLGLCEPDRGGGEDGVGIWRLRFRPAVGSRMEAGYGYVNPADGVSPPFGEGGWMALAGRLVAAWLGAALDEAPSAVLGPLFLLVAVPISLALLAIR